MDLSTSSLGKSDFFTSPIWLVLIDDAERRSSYALRSSAEACRVVSVEKTRIRQSDEPATISLVPASTVTAHTIEGKPKCERQMAVGGVRFGSGRMNVLEIAGIVMICLSSPEDLSQIRTVLSSPELTRSPSGVDAREYTKES